MRLDDVRGAFKMIGINPFLLIKLRFDEKAIKLYETLQGKPSIYNNDNFTNDKRDYYETFLSGNEGISFSSHSLNIIRTLDLIDKLPQLHLNIDKRKVSFEGLTHDNENHIKTALLLGLIVPSEIQVQRVGRANG